MHAVCVVSLCSSCGKNNLKTTRPRGVFHFYFSKFFVPFFLVEMVNFVLLNG